MKKQIVFVVFFAFLANISAQDRLNEPLIQFSANPIGILQSGIIGWMRSTDGQWISAENTIPKRFSSFDDEKYEMPENKLGNDNTLKIEVYDATFQNERIWAVIKYMRNGAYKYHGTKRGWKEWTDAYYFLVRPDDLMVMDNLEDSVIHVMKIPAIYGGTLRKIDNENITVAIQKHVRFGQSFDRELVLMLQLFRGNNTARFAVSSNHKVFPEIEGILHNFTYKGKSLYGRPALFDYCYFETSMYDLGQVFPIL